MRLPIFDRFLLACFLVCAFIHARQSKVFGVNPPPTCDTKCRMIQVYYEDQGKSGINCFNWDQTDCQVCNTGKSTCVTTAPPGAGTCTVDETKTLNYSGATVCTLECDLPVGLWAYATGMNGNNWKGAGFLNYCKQ